MDLNSKEEKELAEITIANMRPMRKISIILLWWSRTPDLEKMAKECLLSILENTKYPAYEVIVIENKSMHPSKFLREFKHDKVRIFLQDTNLGFVKGNNLGFKLAGDNDVLLLNDDTLVPVGWLQPIITTLENNPDCGMAMPGQIHKGSKEYFEYEGNIPNILDYLAKIIFKNRLKDMSGKMQSGNWLPLCATAITRKALNEVGYLDEEFGLGGFEDVDYSWRCLDAGLSLYITSGSAIFHHYGQSFHYHEGLSEIWVEKGKYLLNKHNATQDTENNSYRIKDKSEDWFRNNLHKIKPEDIKKFEAIYGKVENNG